MRDSRDDRRRARDERGLRSTAAQRGDRLPPPPRERRPVLAALAVLLIVGGAAVAGLLALRADARTPVLVAARDIAAGAEITRDDLTTAPVAADGTMLVPADRADEVLGTYARTGISAGQLLDTAMVTQTATLQPGLVAVGAVLEAGRAPASGLLPGDVVQLVDVADGSTLVPDALVSSARSQGDGDAVGSSRGLVATLIVDDRDGAAVATLAASGNLAAVLVERGTPLGDG
ncbi:SAF domain-containing protein [Actinotalea sp. AC32]|nr:SAF domain-containing protein [Actinotalea sp. AC32]